MRSHVSPAGLPSAPVEGRSTERRRDVVAVEVGVVVDRLDALAQGALVPARCRRFPRGVVEDGEQVLGPLVAPASSSANSAPERPRRSATSRSVTSGEPSPSNRPSTMSTTVPMTWAATSPTDQPSQRLGVANSSGLSEATNCWKIPSSSMMPVLTSSRDSVTWLSLSTVTCRLPASLVRLGCRVNARRGDSGHVTKAPRTQAQRTATTRRACSTPAGRSSPNAASPVRRARTSSTAPV